MLNIYLLARVHWIMSRVRFDFGGLWWSFFLFKCIISSRRRYGTFHTMFSFNVQSGVASGKLALSIEFSCSQERLIVTN